MQFINREIELRDLNERWKKGSSEFFVIYGRRRVGKTELIKQFMKEKPSIYYMADKRSSKEQLRELGRLFGEYFKDDLLFKNGFNEWLEVFQYLKKNIKNILILLNRMILSVLFFKKDMMNILKTPKFF